MSHLIIAKGRRQSEEFTITSQGMRVGRAKSNDLVVDEDALSQHHCRFFFKSDGTLWVTDFGSTNQTLVNNVPVMQQRLERGDLVDVGGVVFKVVNDEPADFFSDPARQRKQELDGMERLPSDSSNRKNEQPIQSSDKYDLGFKREERGDRRSLILRLGWALVALLLIVVLALVAIRFAGDIGDFSATESERAVDLPIAIHYEKVEADRSNIFRYELTLYDNLLSIKIDDIKNSRHVAREKEIGPEIVADLRDRIMESEFFYLRPDYAGVSPDIHESWDLTITIGRTTSRTRVFNRREPSDFQEVRTMIEEFGRTELGLAALALSPERLREMARDAYLLGRKNFQERAVRYENLSESIKNYTLAQWYLETIEPKPDFYRDAVAGLEDAERELNERYEDYAFRADRAIKLGDWEEAARNLRIILRLIPDRNDSRHAEARDRLLTVERRL